METQLNNKNKYTTWVRVCTSFEWWHEEYNGANIPHRYRKAIYDAEDVEKVQNKLAPYAGRVNHIYFTKPSDDISKDLY